MKTALTWFILVSVTGMRNGLDAPTTMGPYPSAEMCRLAGYDRFPFDERFWTQEQIAARRKADAAREAQRQKELLTAKHDKDGWAKLSDGSMVHFNNKGEQDSWASSLGSGQLEICPCYRAITNCMRVESTVTIRTKKGQP